MNLLRYNAYRIKTKNAYFERGKNLFLSVRFYETIEVVLSARKDRLVVLIENYQLVF